MARPALLPLALAVLVVLAGCSALPGRSQTTPANIDAHIVGTTSTGGTCVDDPMNGFVVESTPNDDGTRTVTVEANVTVPGAHYVLDETTLSTVGENDYRLDINTTPSTQKPEQPCENGGIVHYSVTIVRPDTDSFELTIYHDGRAVSGLGSGAET